MKKITQINQYLLEHYPTIWNTKLVWMLLISLIIHIIFYFIGFISYINPKSLQTQDVLNDYVENGLIYVQLLITLLLLVGWLVLMFRNNAFKNFYPTSQWKLYSQFLHYFIIILATTTFYFSYMLGFKTYINHKYHDAKMQNYISVINKTSPFLSTDIESYFLNRKSYPKIFNDLYCQTDINLIDRSQKYFVYYDRVYQYWETYPKKAILTDRNEVQIPEPEKSNNTPIAFRKDRKGGYQIIYFMKKVVDLSPYIKTAYPSYVNFSEVFYEDNDGEEYNDFKESYKNQFSIQQQNVNKNTVELLNKKDPKEIEKLLQSFLEISKELQISNNLDAKSWTKMVYHPDNFELKYFIRRYKPENGKLYDPNIINSEDFAAPDVSEIMVDNEDYEEQSNFPQDYNPNYAKEISPEEYFKKHLTHYYYYDHDLNNMLTNIDNVKEEQPVKKSLFLNLWISFILASIIFCYRITNLRTFLYSIISTGILVLLIILFLALINFGIRSLSGLYVYTFIFSVLSVVLLIPIFWLKELKKLVAGILLNISIVSFVVWVLLIFMIINAYQLEHCPKFSEVCPTIFNEYEKEINYFVILCGLIFMYFYTKTIQNYKAKPE